jgi:hypothetical protein
LQPQSVIVYKTLWTETRYQISGIISYPLPLSLPKREKKTEKERDREIDRERERESSTKAVAKKSSCAIELTKE